MLLEALEILQSTGQEVDTFVTDFGVYKVTYILTVYLPLILSTFLFSQEYLGAKVACFAPASFSENHADALNEYCWNNGFWVSEGVDKVKSLYTQPHRFYPLYLPIQAVLFMSPIVLWNILTKSHLLAVLRATEDFLDELLEIMHKEDAPAKETRSKMRTCMRTFHQTCVHAAQKSDLAKIGISRVVWEMFLLLFTLLLQFFIYNHKVKEYECRVPEIDATSASIMCTVPILDLLDGVWSLNVAALLIALSLNLVMVGRLYHKHFREFQPLFYNNLPYGDTDDFNESVRWDSRWTKESYRLLTRLFMENNSIMTKAYVLMAMKPQVDEAQEAKPAEEESSDDENSQPSKASNGKATNGHAANFGGFERKINSIQGHESAKPYHQENDHRTSLNGDTEQEDVVTNGLRQRGCTMKIEEAVKRDFVEPL